MSDTSLNKIIQYGTAAARAAYVPAPAVGSKVLYIWFDTDASPNTYVWNGAAWVQIAGSAVSGLNQLTGDVTAGPGTGSQVATIPNNTVTYAKIQDVSATKRILARKTAGSGDIEEATLSEILDFITSAAQGDILYRGAATWARLGAGTSGQFLKTQGAGADPVWATVAAGSVFGTLVKPVVGDYAWVNQGGATATDYTNGVYFKAPAGAGTSFRIFKKAAPGTPYTITAAFVWAGQTVDFHQFGLCFRESGSGKLVSVVVACIASVTPEIPLIISQKFTNATTFSANYLVSSNLKFNFSSGLIWLRIADDGANRIASISPDGVNWIAIHTVGRTDFITADEVGFMFETENATYDLGFSCVHWAAA